jgi:hypothetical protein
MGIWLSIIIATLAIQLPNIWAINKFAESPSLNSAFVIAFFCLPASFIANTGYAYYYGFGYEKYSYPVMAIGAYGISLLISFIVQSFILKNKDILFVDLISIFLIISGLLVMIYRTEIQSLITK